MSQTTMHLEVMTRDPSGAKLAKRIIQLHVTGTNAAPEVEAVCRSLGMVDTYNHFRADCTTPAELDRARNALAPYFETTPGADGRVYLKR